MSAAEVALDAGYVDFLARQSRTSGRENTKSIEDQIAMGDKELEQSVYGMGERLIETDTSGMLPLAQRKQLLRAVERVEVGKSKGLIVAYAERLTRDPAVKDEVVNRIEAAGGFVTSLDMGPISNKSAMAWFASSISFMQAKVVSMQAREKTNASKQRNIDAGIPPQPGLTAVYEKITPELLLELPPDEAERLRPFKGMPRLHPVNAPLFREVVEMRLQSASWTQLARWLREQGCEVTVHGLQSTLASPLLVGEIHFGDFTPNLHAWKEWPDGRFMDRRTWDRLQKTRGKRGRYTATTRLLSKQQILKCETCGYTMSVTSMTQASGNSYQYYKCSNRMCEKKAIIRAEDAEAVIRDECIRLAGETKGRVDFHLALEAARLAADEAEADYDWAYDYARGRRSDPVAQDGLRDAERKRDAVVAEHERLLALATPDLTITAADWDATVTADDGTVIPLLTLEEKRAAVRSVIAYAVVSPGRGPGRITVVPQGISDPTSSAV